MLFTRRGKYIQFEESISIYQDPQQKGIVAYKNFICKFYAVTKSILFYRILGFFFGNIIDAYYFKKAGKVFPDFLVEWFEIFY